MKGKNLEEINNRISAISDNRKRKIINSILKDDNWFLKVSTDVAISILIDLGYKKSDAISLYESLIVPE